MPTTMSERFLQNARKMPCVKGVLWAFLQAFCWHHVTQAKPIKGAVTVTGVLRLSLGLAWHPTNQWKGINRKQSARWQHLSLSLCKFF